MENNNDKPQVTPAENEAPHMPELPEQLRIIPYSDGVLFPFMILPIHVTSESGKQLVEEAASTNRMLAVFAAHAAGAGAEVPVYGIGTAARIVRMLRRPDDSIQVILQGTRRIQLEQLLQQEPYLLGKVAPLAEQGAKTMEQESLLRMVLGKFDELVELAPYLTAEMAALVKNLNDPGQQADFMAANLNLKQAEQQELLAEADVNARLKRLLRFQERELEILKIGSKIQQDIKQSLDKAQREAFLRKQLEAIKKELGETDEQTTAVNELRQQVEEAGLPEEVLKVAERELKRMSEIPPMSPEYNVSRSYLDWIVSLPWSNSTADNLDIERAQTILDEDHYDLEKVKERILEYLAVRKLKENMKGPILCFAGPPGTGKTSLGKSIARALGRKFIRMSLGGVRDEAEIRGHRRTYIGALPGRIIQSLQRAGSNNPVMMLDEIDKLGADYRGDPSSALLEVLDPEQNNSFADHYLDVAFDLSKVLFIATANIIETIPGPLRDRMEVLELPGYTEVDKIAICKKYLLPKQIEEHGLKPEDLRIDDRAIAGIIRGYAREAGVRNLERSVAALCRKSARRIAAGAARPIHIEVGELRDILGPERYRHGVAEEKDEVGVVVGLAWTPVGGDILFIESTVVPGRGTLKLTGKIGEVMRESAEAAMTYVRSRARYLGLRDDFYEKKDVHVHLPEGAIPKDGPSAGISLTTALVSAFTRRPVRKDVAMTGEITLRGKVLPVGGVRDKVLAAHRAGIKTVILPANNEAHTDEIPDNVKSELNFVFVRHMDEVLAAALHAEEQDESSELHYQPMPVVAESDRGKE